MTARRPLAAAAALALIDAALFDAGLDQAAVADAIVGFYRGGDERRAALGLIYGALRATRPGGGKTTIEAAAVLRAVGATFDEMEVAAQERGDLPADIGEGRER